MEKCYECSSEQAQRILKELDMAIAYGRKKLEAAKEVRPFVIVLCGAFSTGKTSLGNAILGCDLPTGINPITKTVTKLRYGDRERFWELILDTGKEQEISPENAQELATGRKIHSEYKNRQLIVELPSPFLKSGIIMVDTPGFEDDEKEKLDELTKKEIRESDFCIVNFSSNRFGSKSEREFLLELQEMTNGNFISVLNCMNYLMQAGQVEDLINRANSILKEFGNDKIGRGRYFMVDSSDRKQADLGGLDEWLEELLTHKALSIQADTSLSMALAELRRTTAHSDAYIRELTKHIARLREQNEENIQAERGRMRKNQIRTMQKINGQLPVWQDDMDRAVQLALYSAKAVNPAEFQKEAQKKIMACVLAQAQKIDQWLKREGMGGPVTIWQRFYGVMSKFSVPEPEYELRERGLFDFDRYLEGRYYRVYNDYIAEARKKIQHILLPKLKRQVQRYADEIEEMLKEMRQSCGTGGYEQDIWKTSETAELLSEKSLEAMSLQHKVRKEKEKLLRRYE